jgi:hypothetical protein
MSSVSCRLLGPSGNRIGRGGGGFGVRRGSQTGGVPPLGVEENSCSLGTGFGGSMIFYPLMGPPVCLGHSLMLTKRSYCSVYKYYVVYLSNVTFFNSGKEREEEASC